jgi:hypothetical protein
MIYRKRTDANHATMAAALREAGFSVHDMSKCGWGVPDLLICRKEHAQSVLDALKVATQAT